MNHQLAVFTPMIPRLPLALIAVRLPVNSMEAVCNKVSYTPLALVFRHIRAINAESTHSLCYINQAGDNIVIAPRIHLTLLWATELQSIVNPHLPTTQQIQLNNGRHQAFNPFQKQHIIKNSEQLTFRKQTLSSSVNTLFSQMKSSVAVKKVETKIDTFAQQDTSTNHALSVLSSVVARRYLVLRDRGNDQLKRDKKEVMMPAMAFMDNLKYKYFNQYNKLFTQPDNSESVPVKLNLQRSVYSDVVEFTRKLKKSQSIISLLIQRQQKTVNKPASFFQFSGQKGMLLGVDNNSFIRGIIRSSMQLFRQRHIHSIDNRLFTTNTSHLLSHSKGLFTQLVTRNNQQARSPVAVDTTAYAKPTTIISKVPANIRSLDKQLHHKNQSLQRKVSSNYQQTVAKAEVVYRTNKVPATTPSVPVPIAPEPIPVVTPQIDIDRLSTDVWRQLEKRIRIERERHGQL